MMASPPGAAGTLPGSGARQTRQTRHTRQRGPDLMIRTMARGTATSRRAAFGIVGLVVAVLVAACGSGGGTTSPKSAGSPTTAVVNKNAGTTITVGSFNFGESEILANMYADILKKAGFNVVVKAKLGNREVVEPALESGQIDLVPEY